MGLAEIPKRTFFRASEVCAIAGVQPYVLKSWEAEFPSLAGAKREKGVRVYARSEVELVLRIKELVFGEGLTLGAARKQLEAEGEDDATAQELPLDELLEADVREKLDAVKQGLRAVVKMLS